MHDAITVRRMPFEFPDEIHPVLWRPRSNPWGEVERPSS